MAPDTHLLDSWRSSLQQIRDLLLQVLSRYRNVDSRADDVLREAYDLSEATMLQLELAGASRSEQLGSITMEAELVSLDSESNRELLVALDKAVHLSYKVNQERNRRVSGTSQLLEYLREMTALECEGPRFANE